MDDKKGRRHHGTHLGLGKELGDDAAQPDAQGARTATALGIPAGSGGAVWIPPDMGVAEMLDVFVSSGASSVPIVDVEGDVLGEVRAARLIAEVRKSRKRGADANDELAFARAVDFATPAPAPLPPDASVADAAALLAANPGSVAVIVGPGGPVRTVGADDVVRWLAHAGGATVRPRRRPTAATSSGTHAVPSIGAEPSWTVGATTGDFTPQAEGRRTIHNGGANAVVVVAASSSLANRLAAILDDAGYLAYPSADAIEAMAVMRAMRLPPGLLVLDTALPNADGRRLVTILQAQAASERVAVLALGKPPGPEWSAREIVPKPIESNRLLRAVRHCLGDASGTQPF